MPKILFGQFEAEALIKPWNFQTVRASSKVVFTVLSFVGNLVCIFIHQPASLFIHKIIFQK